MKRFCKFRFFGDPHVHESFSRDPHGPVLRFNTKHLVLPGLIDEEKLSEDLLRKKFKVEVLRVLQDLFNRFMTVILDFQMTYLAWPRVFVVSNVKK